MNRRTFLAGILATGAAPWVVRAGVLMPVQSVWRPQYGSVMFDHAWDDDGIKGIMELPNGIITGFYGNELCLSAPPNPFAWPILCP